MGCPCWFQTVLNNLHEIYVSSNWAIDNWQFFLFYLWKQVLPSQINGRTGITLKNSFWVKAFLLGALAGCRKDRNLLRLLTILETMTNNNRVGSNVDLFCKLYYNFDQNGPGQGWFDPPLLFFSFFSSFFLSLSFTKQSYLSLTYMDNVMPWII